ncbi:hypothetical protein V4G99_13585 [Bacillus halotolerans]|nr:hypothetical protein [Halalkalibacterium halodurans]
MWTIFMNSMLILARKKLNKTTVEFLKGIKRPPFDGPSFHQGDTSNSLK